MSYRKSLERLCLLVELLFLGTSSFVVFLFFMLLVIYNWLTNIKAIPQSVSNVDDIAHPYVSSYSLPI